MVSQLNKVLFGDPWGTQNPALTICSLPPIIPRDPLWLLHCVTPMFVMVLLLMMMIMVIFAENKEIYEDDNVGASFGSNPVPHHVFVMS